MFEEIVTTTQFPELQVRFDTQIGAIEKIHGPGESKQKWVQAGQKRGFRPAANGTLTDGVSAVVMLP